ncbi:MAG: hypothetical protein ACK5O5_01270 [bacterium]
MRRRFSSALMLLGLMLILLLLGRGWAMEAGTIEQQRTRAQQLRRDG